MASKSDGTGKTKEKSKINTQSPVPPIQTFFEQELAFTLFCAQIFCLTFHAWFLGYFGFSVAWSFIVAYVVAMYWHRIVDLFVKEQVDLLWCRKLNQIENPRNESVEWANHIVDRWLRFSEPEIATLTRSILNPILRSCKPVFLDSLEMTSFSLGSGMPRISSISVDDLSVNVNEKIIFDKIRDTLTEKEIFELVIELDFEHNSPDFLIQVIGNLKTIAPEQILRTYGLNLTVNVEKLKFSGRCQIGVTFDRKLPFPHAKHAWVMFLDEEPCISMSIMTMHTNVMALPKLNDWINTIVKTSLSDYVYYPHRFFIPLYQEPGVVKKDDYTRSDSISGATESSAVEVRTVGASRAEGLLFVTLMYGNVDDPTSASCKSDDPIWCTVKLDASGSQTPARPANKPWAEDVAFLVYNLESDKLLVNVKSKSMLGKLTLAEYSVNIGKIGLEDGREKAIKPFKHKSQKLGSKDIPDLRFKLTYHKLGSFAIADKIRRISRITESIITDHPGFKAHMNGSGLDQVDGGDESGEDSDVENGDTAKSEISENGEKAADRRLYRRTSSIIEEPISCVSGVVTLLVHSGHNLPAMDLNGLSDPYVNIWFNNNKIKQSPPIKRTLNPIWNFHCDFMVEDFTVSQLLIEVFDWDGMTTKDDYIGNCELNIGELREKKRFDLRDDSGAIGSVGFIIVSLMFQPFPQLKEILEADNQPERRTFSRSRSTAVLPHSASVISRPKAQSLDYSLEKQLGIIEEDDHEDVELVILRASGLRAADPGGTSDPFCVITVDGNQHKIKTDVVYKTLDPVWNERLIIPYPYKIIEIKVMDKDTLRDDFLGRVIFLTKDKDGVNLVHKVMAMCADDPNYEHEMELRDKDSQGQLFIRINQDPFKRRKHVVEDDSYQSRRTRTRKESDEEVAARDSISAPVTSLPAPHKKQSGAKKQVGKLLKQVSSY
ncbi:uncharacterized protein LOC142352006 isoform X3 [Convolutriloba macropyga]|uniref:uncharacterized protein LOC142352006 isoform X3 n=1 Tax=Convolutriloba macropyga TaxID=536237 RepID=UPI003F521776